MLGGLGAGGWYAVTERGIAPEFLWFETKSQVIAHVTGLAGDWLGIRVESVAGAAPDAAKVVAAGVAPTQVPTMPEPGLMAPAVVGTGYVIADREMVLMSDISARLSDVLVETGDRFLAGQVLAVLDDTAAQTELAIVRARLAMAQATLAQAEASLEEAASDAARQAALAGRGSVPQAQAEAASFALIQAERFWMTRQRAAMMYRPARPRSPGWRLPGPRRR